MSCHKNEWIWLDVQWMWHLLVLNSSNEVRLFFTWRISVRPDPPVSCITVQNIGHGIILIVLSTHQVTRSEQTSVTVSGPGLGSVSAATSCVSLHRSQSHSPVSRFSKLLRNSFSKLKSRTVPKTSLRSKSRSRTTFIDCLWWKQPESLMFQGQ